MSTYLTAGRPKAVARRATSVISEQKKGWCFGELGLPGGDGDGLVQTAQGILGDEPVLFPTERDPEAIAQQVVAQLARNDLLDRKFDLFYHLTPLPCNPMLAAV